MVLTMALLQACAPKVDTGSRLRVYAVDLAGGARTCSVPRITPAAGQTTEAAIKLVNDGGWCGLPLYQPGPKPYDVGLLTARPEHGSVLIHEVGDETRIDYTPDRRFAGSDSFSVRLLPGNETIHVAATVEPPAGK